MKDQKKREKVIALLERYVDAPNLAGVENYGAKIVDMPAPLIIDALALLKAQEPVEPKRLRDWEREPPRCGNCGALIVIIGNPFTEHVYKAKFCCECGRPVKWE